MEGAAIARMALLEGHSHAEGERPEEENGVVVVAEAVEVAELATACCCSFFLL